MLRIAGIILLSCSPGKSPKKGRNPSAFGSRLLRSIRYGYIRLVRINDSPQKIAWGLAVGVFLGVFPTFGLATVVALALAIALKFNKAAAILGSLIMNPLTTPLFWTASSVLGAFLVNRDWHRTREMVQAFSAHLSLADLATREGWVFLLKGLGTGAYAYLLGNLLISLVLAVIVYFVGLHLTRAYRARRRFRIRGHLPVE
jgi:uncharacterized protein (DUF2062 family)